jgi:hypothetical protein
MLNARPESLLGGLSSCSRSRPSPVGRV